MAFIYKSEIELYAVHSKPQPPSPKPYSPTTVIIRTWQTVMDVNMTSVELRGPGDPVDVSRLHGARNVDFRSDEF